MAKKRNRINIGGGVSMPAPHFRNPALADAYQKWFVDMPLRAPVTVEWIEPSAADKARRLKQLNSRSLISRGEMLSGARANSQDVYITGDESEGGGLYTKGTPAFADAQRRMREAGYGGTFGTSAKGLGPGTKEMAAELNKNNRLIATAKGSPVGQAKKGGGGVLPWLMDKLYRPLYATTGLAKGIAGATKKADFSDPASIANILEAGGKGAGRGFMGKEKDTFGSMIARTGLDEAIESGINKVGGDSPFTKGLAESTGNFWSATAGFGADVGLDPLSYTGVGLVPKAGKAAGLSAKALEHLRQAGKVDDLTGELLSGGRYAKGKVKQSTALGEKAQIFEPLDKLHGAVKARRYKEIKTEMLDSPEWSARITSSLDKSAASQRRVMADINATARELAQKESDAWLETALKNYEDVVNTQIQKGVGFGLAGARGKKLTVVPAPIATAFTRSIIRPEPVQKGLRVFQDVFQASAGVDPALHSIRLSTLGAGFQRAHMLGHELRQVFRGVSKDDQDMIASVALGRGKNSGVIVNVGGKEVDAAQYYHNRLGALENKVSGIATGDPEYSAAELSDMLPPGFKGQFKADQNNWIRSSIKSWEEKGVTGPNALWLAEQAFERAASKRAMFASAGETFGVRTAGTGTLKGGEKLFNKLREQGYREIHTKATHGLLDGMLFDPQIASGLEKILKVMESERSWNGFTKTLSRINYPIKFLFTVVNPGFHIRNAMGDTFINMMDNVSIRSYEQSARVLHKQLEKFGGDTPLLLQEGDILENAFKRPNQRVLFHTRKPVKRPNGTKGAAITDAEIYAGINKYGIRQNYALSEYGTLSEQPIGVAATGRQLRSKVVEASEVREDYFRVAHFIELVKRNKKGFGTLDEVMADAAADIRKMHFDYTDFTKFEKQWMSNLFPFYKWTRKALPLMMELMLTQPGKVIVPTKAQQALSTMMGQDPYGEPLPNMQGLVPDWMIQAGYSPSANLANALPWDTKDNPAMFQVPSPFGDIVNSVVAPTLGKPSGILDVATSMLTPVIKDPYELKENKNAFLSSKAGQNVPLIQPGESKIKGYSDYFLNQLPYARQGTRAFSGGEDKKNIGGFISQLAGLYGQEVSPSMQRGELFRQRDVSRTKVREIKSELGALLKKQGLDVPKTNEGWLTLIRLWKQQQGNQ